MVYTWKEIVAIKKKNRDAIIEDFRARSGERPALEEFTKIATIEGLQQLYTSGEASVEEVVWSYIASATAAHVKTNCLTEICFEDAIKSAKVLDTERRNGKIGSLHGIPISLKDQFNLEGFDSTIGYVGRALKPAGSDATLVTMLRSLGAVIHAKTNLPQSIMWCETENPIWGLTTNPDNADYTPGGSTGGEAALLATQGSLVGFGTDIGGSIRIPAHMMGIYGLKPSSSRLPYNGVPVSTEGQEHVPSSVGPMARSLSSIKDVMKALVDAKPWEFDARCSPIPWRTEAYEAALSKPLTIGFLMDDGVVRPHPPITRVLRSVVDALEAAGHDVFEWDSSLHQECINVMDNFYSSDGGMDIRNDIAVAGEPLIPHVERLVNRGESISVYDYWQLNRKKWALQQAYLEKWKRLTSPTTGRMADFVILPPMPHASVPHGGCRWVGYTKIWNVLDYSALVIPAGRIEPEDLSVDWHHKHRNEMDAWNAELWTTNMAEMVKAGFSVGIQIVGRKLEEEKVLAAGKVLDNLIRKL